VAATPSHHQWSRFAAIACAVRVDDVAFRRIVYPHLSDQVFRVVVIVKRQSSRNSLRGIDYVDHAGTDLRDVKFENPGDSADVPGAWTAMDDANPITDAHKRGCDKQEHDYAGDYETRTKEAAKATQAKPGGHNDPRVQQAHLRSNSRLCPPVLALSRLRVWSELRTSPRMRIFAVISRLRAEDMFVGGGCRAHQVVTVRQAQLQAEFRVVRAHVTI
jgi:hypothetical protein